MTKTSDPGPPGLSKLAETAGSAISGGAPVHLWNPPFCGEMDMRIAADGRWFHEGRPIERSALVRLFASILRVEDDGRTYLVTPVEKLSIVVDDAHFLAVEVERGLEGGHRFLSFRTNMGDVVRAGPRAPLVLPREPAAEFRPYLTMRQGLRARPTRAVALELAEWLEEDEAGYFLMSDGARFPGPRRERDDG